MKAKHVSSSHALRRRRLVIGGIVLAALLAPFGRYSPYPHTTLRASQVVQTCRALPGERIGKAVGRPVATSMRLAAKPNAEIENLFPSISINECDYRWHVTCSHATSLRSLTLTVVDLPDSTQALSRYTYARLLLQSDSTGSNDFRDFFLEGRRAYEIALQNEVLVRVLDGHFIIDMQYHLCTTASASEQEAAVHLLVEQLRLPISALAVPRSQPPRISKLS